MSISSMKNAVSNMVANTIYLQTQNMKAKRGTVRGGTVTIGNKVLPFTAAVDMYFEDGDSVWCIVADDNRTAVVVGV